MWIPLECVALGEATYTCTSHMDWLRFMDLWSVHGTGRINSSLQKKEREKSEWREIDV